MHLLSKARIPCGLSSGPVLALALGLALAGAAQAAPRADETDETESRLTGPLDLVTCGAVPKVSLLGVTVDASQATFKNVACDQLVLGDLVEVRLSDTSNLAATQIELEDQPDRVRIQAAVQKIVKQTGNIVTLRVLGQLVDTRQARFQSDKSLCPDPNDEADACHAAIAESTVVVGQFVEIKLDPGNPLDLLATHVEVRNYGNGLQISVLQPNGQPETRLVTVFIFDTVKVRNAQGQLVTKEVKFRAEGKGRVVVRGLPTGQASILVKRADGKTGGATIAVQLNKVRMLQVRLR